LYVDNAFAVGQRLVGRFVFSTYTPSSC